MDKGIISVFAETGVWQLSDVPPEFSDVLPESSLEQPTLSDSIDEIVGNGDFDTVEALNFLRKNSLGDPVSLSCGSCRGFKKRRLT